MDFRFLPFVLNLPLSPFLFFWFRHFFHFSYLTLHFCSIWKSIALYECTTNEWTNKRITFNFSNIKRKQNNKKQWEWKVSPYRGILHSLIECSFGVRLPSGYHVVNLFIVHIALKSKLKMHCMGYGHWRFRVIFCMLRIIVITIIGIIPLFFVYHIVVLILYSAQFSSVLSWLKTAFFPSF